jgi:hypothetical protein
MKLGNVGVASFALLVGIASCGWLPNKTDRKGDGIAGSGANKGCIQGVVRNGLTGERMKLSKEGNQGISMLIRNKQFKATYIVANPDDKNADSNLFGEYYLCGFPLDESFPLLANQEGFQPFEARVLVVSTIAQRTPNSQQKDLNRPFPTLNADIELYPKGIETKDLKIVVLNKGEKVKGAKVLLHATAITADGFGQKFDKSTNGDVFEKTVPQIRQAPIEVETDDDGEAIYASDELALGIAYQVVVVARGAEQSMLTASRTIFVGYRGQGTNLGKEPYSIVIALDGTATSPGQLQR